MENKPYYKFNLDSLYQNGGIDQKFYTSIIVEFMCLGTQLIGYGCVLPRKSQTLL